MKGKSYDAAYKQELLGLLENGRKAADVAREYGIHVKTICRWVDEGRRDGVEAFPGKGNLKPADQELRDLRRQVRELEEENAILKKAAAIFAKHQK